MIMCEEENRVKCFHMSADNLQTWLQSVGTCDVLEEYIMRFVRSRNGKRFVECVSGDQDPIVNKLDVGSMNSKIYSAMPPNHSENS